MQKSNQFLQNFLSFFIDILRLICSENREIFSFFLNSLQNVSGAYSLSKSVIYSNL